MPYRLEKIRVEKDQISLKEVILNTQKLFNYIISKRKAIIMASIIGAVAGLSYSFFYVPKYTAVTSFVLENKKSGGLGDYANIAARFGLSNSSGGGLFQDDYNMMSFLQSRTMIARSLYSKITIGNKEQLLADRFKELKKYNKKWSEIPELRNLQFHTDSLQRTLLEDSVITFFCKEIIRNHLSVGKPDIDEAIIVITTTSEDELFSKFFNEFLLNNAVSFFLNMQTLRSLENVQILEHQVDSIRGLLNNAITSVAVSSDAYPNVNPALQRLRVPSQKRLVDVEMNKAILEELVKNLELAKITLRKETPLVQVIDTPVLPLEKLRLGKIKGTILGLMIFATATVLYYTLKRFYYSVLRD